MSTKFLVACDGSQASGRALALAVSHAKLHDATLVLAHVLDWAAYSFLTTEELEERQKRRGDDIKRAEQSLMAPIKAFVTDSGVTATTKIRYGHITQVLADLAKSEEVSQIFMGRSGNGLLSSIVFGSVASNVTKISPVPCIIVP